MARDMIHGVLAALAVLMLLGRPSRTSADSPTTEDDRTPVERSGGLVNSIGMKLVPIEAGEFVMGAEEGDFDERPVHKVTITRPFLMAATEVTNSQYEQFDPDHKKLRGHRGLSKDDDEAVIFVSWTDAQAFCQWLSRKERKPYRLPTEAEWEYACRAGTVTKYNTGDELPATLLNHQESEWDPRPTRLHVGRTPANAWGLHDMHGNVEQWCSDWYGPYASGSQADPVGRVDGDFRVTRGGSHSTPTFYLRSANRSGTLPDDTSWLIGLRVVQAPPPHSTPLPPPPAPLWAKNVRQDRFDWAPPPGYDADEPYFLGPQQYVYIPPNSEGPLFSKHNHQPAITACPNGDLLAIWYTCRSERGRELAVTASRLRRGADRWDPASPFWDAPDRNDHGSDLWWDGKNTLYQFNGLSHEMGWSSLALIMRTSMDNGKSWSKARLIAPEHRVHHQVIAGAFRTKEGCIIVKCDAGRGGAGGSVIHISRDEGRTWVEPSAGRPDPEFDDGGTGAWIAGIHAGVAQRTDGGLIALGRGNSINDQMPKSVSSDMGRNWTYSASGFPPIGGGQRPVLMRLREGPLLFISFAHKQVLQDANGQPRTVSGLFAALSDDDGQSWPVRRLVTDDGPPRRVDGGGNTHEFTLGPESAEPKGYMAATQTPDGIIHLISSKQHYAFNVAWIKTPMPAAK